MTIAVQVACEAKGLTFRDLPLEVIRQVKRTAQEVRRVRVKS
jgi:hypothetical protein